MAFAASLTEKRGPRVGDAASLWNFTAAPGWSREEVAVLRLCLMKHGVGQWLQILGTGLLPGKLIQQLNGQTQRLLGQQSLAAFTGLRLDVDRVRTDNAARTTAKRKAGLIIYDGPLLTREMKAELKEEAQRKYGLTPEQLRAVDVEMATMVAAAAPPPGAGAAASAAANAAASAAAAAATAAAAPAAAAAAAAAASRAGVRAGQRAALRLDPDMAVLLSQPAADLSPDQLARLLLPRLRNRLACLTDRLRQRLDLPAREGPRWGGEAEAGALLAAVAAAAAGASRASVAGAGLRAGAAAPAGRQSGGGAGGRQSSGGSGGAVAGAARASGGGSASNAPLVVSLPFSRELMAEATAGRMRAGPSGLQAAMGQPQRLPPLSGGGAQGGGAKKRSRPSKPSDGGGAENARPPVSRPRATAGGGKRRAVSEDSAAEADGGGDGGAASRRGVRSKRATARYDKYVDDAEYEEADPGAYGNGGDAHGNPYGGGGAGAADSNAAISTLTAMGFTPRKARGALRECDFNVEAAVEWLFANCV